MFLTGGKHLLGRVDRDSASSEVSCEVPCFAMGRIKKLGQRCKLLSAEGVVPSRGRRNHCSDVSWWRYPVRYGCGSHQPAPCGDDDGNALVFIKRDIA